MPATPPRPKNWPPDIIFLTSPLYSPSLLPHHLATIRTAPSALSSTTTTTTPSRSANTTAILSLPANTPKGPSPLVRIQAITDPAHPAYGQFGLFAARDLKPGTFVVEYLGVIHASLAVPTSPSSTTAPPTTTSPDPHASSNYDLSLDRYTGIGIDGATAGSEGRFVNDYRGVAGRANAEFREVWCVGREERGIGVWILGVGKGGQGREGKGKEGKGKGKGEEARARERGVRKGEEILVSYGRGFWGARRMEGEEGEGGDEGGNL